MCELGRHRAPVSRERSPRRATRRPSSHVDDQLCRRSGAVALRDAPRRSCADLLRSASRRAPSTSSGSETSTIGLPLRPEIVEDRRRSIASIRIAEQFLQRRDRGLVERRGRSLRRRVVGADRLDRVADELEPDRLARRRPERSRRRRRGRRTRRVRRPDPGACSRPRRADRRDRSARCPGRASA